jgi:DNA-binding transcriptional LysR family regulator
VLDIGSLRYVAAIAEAGSLRRAAAQLNMSQPPLSRRLQRLEDELGVKLFERSVRGLRLTEAGSELAEHARDIIRRVEEASEDARLAANGGAGHLQIGYSDDYLHGTLPRLLAGFSDCYPRVKLEVSLDYSSALARRVAEGTLSLAFVMLPLPAGLANLAVKPLGRLPVLAILPRDHRLATRTKITLEDLIDETLIVGSLDSTSPLYVQLLGTFQRVSFAPRLIHGIHPAEMQVTLASLGRGVAFATPDSARLDRPDIVALPLEEDCALERAMVWNPDSLRAASRTFLKFTEAGFGSDTTEVSG